MLFEHGGCDSLIIVVPTNSDKLKYESRAQEGATTVDPTVL
jgi:hypothetical protein